MSGSRNDGSSNSSHSSNNQSGNSRNKSIFCCCLFSGIRGGSSGPSGSGNYNPESKPAPQSMEEESTTPYMPLAGGPEDKQSDKPKPSAPELIDPTASYTYSGEEGVVDSIEELQPGMPTASGMKLR